MAGVAFNQGTGIALEALVNKTAPQTLILKLYKNNHTPAAGDDESDYTEADFTGYSAKTLTGASWGLTPGAPSLISYAAQQFTSSADQTLQTLYGWYLVQATSGKAIAAGLFDVALEIDTNGQTFLVAPSFTLGNGA